MEGRGGRWGRGGGVEWVPSVVIAGDWREMERERIVSSVFLKIFESFEIMMHKNRCEH